MMNLCKTPVSRSLVLVTGLTGLLFVLAGTSSLASAKSTTPDYRLLGFSSAAEMRNYFTVDRVSIKEIPTRRQIVADYMDVTIIPGTIAPVPTTPSAGVAPTPSVVPTPGLAPDRLSPGLPSAIPSASPSPGGSKPSASVLPAVIGAAEGGLDPSQILPWIALGEKLWSLISSNKPVANVQAQRFAVLPTAQQDWQQMETWKGPAIHTYQIEYKNRFGISVISHSYALAFDYGGSLNGAGHYLANVTMIPSAVTVAWGYTLNSDVEIGTPINTGTKADPIPGIEMQLVSKIDNVLIHKETRNVFFVKGDGTYTELVSEPGNVKQK